MTFDINKKIVFPGAIPGRPALQVRHGHTVTRQRLKPFEKRTGFIHHGEFKGRFILSGFRTAMCRMVPENKETRAVPRPILNSFASDTELIKFRSPMRSDSTDRVILGSNPCPLRVAGAAHLSRAGKMSREPLPALSKSLGVSHHGLHF